MNFWYVEFGKEVCVGRVVYVCMCVYKFFRLVLYGNLGFIFLVWVNIFRFGFGFKNYINIYWKELSFLEKNN